MKAGLLFLPGPCTALQVRRDNLRVRHNGAEDLVPPRIHRLRTIILAGHGSSITSEAVRWCGREGVALYIMERNQECFAIIASAPLLDARRGSLLIRSKQIRAAFDHRKRIMIARRIVQAKLRTLELHPASARNFRDELREARTLEDILTCEARAGAAFFMRFRGAEMRFWPKETPPAHWRFFAARSAGVLKGKGGVSKARYAATPWGAMLNYAYTVALGQCARACIGQGLDPCFGFLHSPKPGRLSLAYDVLELFRAALTAGIFEYVEKRVFSVDDFVADKMGVVRLGSGAARDMAGLALKVASIAECARAVKGVVFRAPTGLTNRAPGPPLLYL